MVSVLNATRETFKMPCLNLFLHLGCYCFNGLCHCKMVALRRTRTHSLSRHSSQNARRSPLHPHQHSCGHTAGSFETSSPARAVQASHGLFWLQHNRFCLAMHESIQYHVAPKEGLAKAKHLFSRLVRQEPPTSFREPMISAYGRRCPACIPRSSSFSSMAFLARFEGWSVGF